MANGPRRMGYPGASSILAILLACVAVRSVCARPGAPAPSTLTSQAQQLTALGQESAGQVAGTANHIGQEINQEGQRQAGNLRKAADIAGAPIASGISSEGAALLEAAQVLGLPRLEQMLSGGSPGDTSPDDDSAPAGSPADSPTESTSVGDAPDLAPAPAPGPGPADDADDATVPSPASKSDGSKRGGKKDTVPVPASASAPTPSRAETPAPEEGPTSAPAGSRGPVAAPRTATKAAYMPDPVFKGKPLERTEEDIKSFKAMKKAQEKKAKKEKKGEGKKGGGDDDELPFPVIYLDQLQNLNDKQLYKIFHRGTGEIPSQISSSTSTPM
jgi:hypothetical protein